MNRHRLAYTALTAALGVLAVVVTALWPSGEHTSLPEPLQAIFPEPGDSVVRQTVIEVELPVGYSLDLHVDGRPVPRGEIGVTTATGVWVWQPGRGRSLEAWESGEHTVLAVWDRVAGGRPDPGEFEWTFRVQ